MKRFRVWLLTLCPLVLFAPGFRLDAADGPVGLSRCEIVPLAEHQVSFQIDGVEITRWHYGSQYPRPFFYPFMGPAGQSLTRMGHPGAPDHDHHRSIWFAHADVNGVNFWSDQTEGRVLQKQWICYSDGEAEAIMACLAGWYDGAGTELLEQETVTATMPLEHGEHAMELQITVRASDAAKTVELGKTNFGFLAVRVAKTLSVHFGGGRLTNSEGQVGEAEIFGRPARWMDYSGPVADGPGRDRKTLVEGITYFDHPDNPRHPACWHVREDGWMGASPCMHEGVAVTREKPLRLRYLLHAHTGPYDQAKADAVHQSFTARRGFQVRKGARQHLQFEVVREK